jgi:hypothetical protein
MFLGDFRLGGSSCRIREPMKPYWTLLLILLFLQVGVFCSNGQGIRVASAYYGSPKRVGVDVTRRVQQFADYGEPFRVGKETLRTDPYPNHRKILVVIYQLNGRQFSDSVEEGDVFYFKSARETGCNLAGYGNAIRISKAKYGARGRYSNVTARVRALARDGRAFTVSDKTFGSDPYPGQRKRLEISYWRNGSLWNRQYAEGDKVRLK